MFWLFLLGLGVMSLLFVMQVIQRGLVPPLQPLFSRIHSLDFSVIVRYAWILSAAIIFGTLAWWSSLQYELWQFGGFTKFFLPPYRGLEYFWLTVGKRLWAPWLIALGGGILARMALFTANRKVGERFFEPTEPLMAGLSMFLVGYPGVLFYIIGMLASGLALSFFYTATRRGRAPLYFLWFPVALFVILITQFVLPGDLLRQFAL
jgi:hypothetical protein